MKESKPSVVIVPNMNSDLYIIEPYICDGEEFHQLMPIIAWAIEQVDATEPVFITTPITVEGVRTDGDYILHDKANNTWTIPESMSGSGLDGFGMLEPQSFKNSHYHKRMHDKYKESQ